MRRQCLTGPRIVAAITTVRLWGLQLGYCEGLHCGHLWIVPISPTPWLPSASMSNVSASFPHVAHGVVWMLPGDISAWSVSSIATVA